MILAALLLAITIAAPSGVLDPGTQPRGGEDTPGPGLRGASHGVAGGTTPTNVRPSWRREVAAGDAPQLRSTAKASESTVSQLGSVLISGQATWYCSASSACTRGYGPSDMVAAIDPSTGIDKGDRVTVRHGDRSIDVTIVDVCACRGSRVIDLTSGAFSRLAPLSAGVIDVELEYGGSDPTPTLPATDMED